MGSSSMSMQETVRYMADVLTTAMFYRSKGATVEWYIHSMCELDPRGEEAEQELRVTLCELGLLTNANSRLNSLYWAVVPH